MTLQRALFAFALSLAACERRAPAPTEGAYWCVVGAPADAEQADHCSAARASCESRVLAAGPSAPGARCEQRTLVAWELHWQSPYGPSEGWYVDAASCERARARRGPSTPACVPASWAGSGRRAH